MEQQYQTWQHFIVVESKKVLQPKLRKFGEVWRFLFKWKFSLPYAYYMDPDAAVNFSLFIMNSQKIIYFFPLHIDFYLAIKPYEFTVYPTLRGAFKVQIKKYLVYFFSQPLLCKKK